MTSDMLPISPPWQKLRRPDILLTTNYFTLGIKLLCMLMNLKNLRRKKEFINLRVVWKTLHCSISASLFCFISSITEMSSLPSTANSVQHVGARSSLWLHRLTHEVTLLWSAVSSPIHLTYSHSWHHFSEDSFVHCRVSVLLPTNFFFSLMAS